MRAVIAGSRRGPALALALSLALSVNLGAGACTPHDEPPEPPEPPELAAPPIVQEIEPEVPLPAIVAPALPPLAPTRPLANLELRWHHTASDGPAATTLWSLGTTLVAMDGEAAKALGLDLLDDRRPDELGGLELPYGASLRRAGPLTLVLSSTEFTAFEHGTNGVRWATPPTTTGHSYAQFISPRALVASFYEASGDRLVAWALEDGRRLWTREGGSGAAFTRVAQLWTDGARGYFVSEAGLEAFDPATGATSWTHPIGDDSCGIATGAGKVVLEDPRGHRILDAELGDEVGRIGVATAACRWNDYEGVGVAPGVIADGRLYAFDGDPGASDARALRAYELDSGRELWTSSRGFGDDSLVVDQDAVFVMRGGQVLVALDAATGKIATEYSLGAWFEVVVEPVGGAAGPLVIVEDEDGGTWVFGRGEQAVSLEDWEIRGRLVSDGHLDEKRLSGVQVWIDGEPVKTDARGRFVARGTSRGAVRVWTRPEDYDPNDWTTVGVDPRRVVFDGSGTYDLGDLEAFEVSME